MRLNALRSQIDNKNTDKRERERRVKNRNKEIEFWQRIWSLWRGQWSFEKCD